MRTKNRKFALKLKPKGEPISSIPKSFLRTNVLPTNVIRKEYRHQIRHDEIHRLNAGGFFYCCDKNPIFTSRNSHKKTNTRGNIKYK